MTKNRKAYPTPGMKYGARDAFAFFLRNLTAIEALRDVTRYVSRKGARVQSKTAYTIDSSEMRLNIAL